MFGAYMRLRVESRLKPELQRGIVVFVLTGLYLYSIECVRQFDDDFDFDYSLYSFLVWVMIQFCVLYNAEDVIRAC